MSVSLLNLTHTDNFQIYAYITIQKNEGKKYLHPKKWLAEDEQNVCFGKEHCLSLSHTCVPIPLLGRSLLIRVSEKS